MVERSVDDVQGGRRVDASVEPVAVASQIVTDLSHLLAELLDNALVFSPPESQVELRGAMAADGYELTVIDRGLGFAPDDLRRHNEVLAAGGAGLPLPLRQLGLPVVARLAGHHGLAVDLDTTGTGTVARVAVPALYLHVDDRRWRPSSGSRPTGRAPYPMPVPQALLPPRSLPDDDDAVAAGPDDADLLPARKRVVLEPADRHRLAPAAVGSDVPFETGAVPSRPPRVAPVGDATWRSAEPQGDLAMWPPPEVGLSDDRQDDIGGDPAPAVVEPPRKRLLGESLPGESLLGESPLGESPLGESPLGESLLGESLPRKSPLGESLLGESPLGERLPGEVDVPLAAESPVAAQPPRSTPTGRIPPPPMAWPVARTPGDPAGTGDHRPGVDSTDDADGAVSSGSGNSEDSHVPIRRGLSSASMANLTPLTRRPSRLGSTPKPSRPDPSPRRLVATSTSTELVQAEAAQLRRRWTSFRDGQERVGAGSSTAPTPVAGHLGSGAPGHDRGRVEPAAAVLTIESPGADGAAAGPTGDRERTEQ